MAFGAVGMVDCEYTEWGEDWVELEIQKGGAVELDVGTSSMSISWVKMPCKSAV
jgi:hypothetical protein